MTLLETRPVTIDSHTIVEAVTSPAIEKVDLEQAPLLRGLVRSGISLTMGIDISARIATDLRYREIRRSAGDFVVGFAVGAGILGELDG